MENNYYMIQGSMSTLFQLALKAVAESLRPSTPTLSLAIPRAEGWYEWNGNGVVTLSFCTLAPIFRSCFSLCRLRAQTLPIPVQMIEQLAQRLSYDKLLERFQACVEEMRVANVVPQLPNENIEEAVYKLPSSLSQLLPIMLSKMVMECYEGRCVKTEAHIPLLCIHRLNVKCLLQQPNFRHPSSLAWSISSFTPSQIPHNIQGLEFVARF